jgi:hypothetical protein
MLSGRSVGEVVRLPRPAVLLAAPGGEVAAFELLHSEVGQWAARGLVL